MSPRNSGTGMEIYLVAGDVVLGLIRPRWRAINVGRGHGNWINGQLKTQLVRKEDGG